MASQRPPPPSFTHISAADVCFQRTPGTGDGRSWSSATANSRQQRPLARPTRLYSFAKGTCGPHTAWSQDHAEAFLEQGIPKCLDQRWDDLEAVMGYCQAFLHPARKATPTNDVGAPCVVEQEGAKDNNEIVCTLKVVNSKGTLLALVAMTLNFRAGPPCQE